MRRERKRTNGPSTVTNDPADDLVRTTLFLTSGINRGLDLVAIEENRPKGEVIRIVLAEYLRGRGFDPSRQVSRIHVEFVPARTTGP